MYDMWISYGRDSPRNGWSHVWNTLAVSIHTHTSIPFVYRDIHVLYLTSYVGVYFITTFMGVQAHIGLSI